MKVYEMMFTDPEQGFIRQWRRNKKGVAELTLEWSQAYPLRELHTVEYLEIPTDKVALIDWLNINAKRSST